MTTTMSDRVLELLSRSKQLENISPEEIPALIEKIGASLKKVDRMGGGAAAEEEIKPAASGKSQRTAQPTAQLGPEAYKGMRAPNDPAVPIGKSITPNYLICLEDGAKLKMLKRYLAVRWNLSPEEYRAKWSLPDNYPMIAPNYARVRSKIATRTGFQAQNQTAKKKR